MSESAGDFEKNGTAEAIRTLKQAVRDLWAAVNGHARHLVEWPCKDRWDDMEVRMRRVERITYIGLGILMALTILREWQIERLIRVAGQ